MHKIKLVVAILIGAIMLVSCGNNDVNNLKDVPVSSNHNVEKEEENSLKEDAKKVEVTEETDQENTAEEDDQKESEDIKEEDTKESETKNDDTNKEQEVKESEEKVNAEDNEVEQVVVDSNLNDMAVSAINYKLKNNIIVLDPGHATKADLSKESIGPGASQTKYKQTGGAYGQFTGTPEYVVNMNVAKKIKTYLEQKGFFVVMTKTENSTVMANSARAKVGNDADAALVIRIHADGSNNQSAKGASMLIPSNNQYCSSFYAESKAYGKFLLDAMCSQVGIKNRGLIERSDISGFNWSTVPVVLVEMGFLSNKEEDHLLSSDAYQDKIARALANGVAAIGIKEQPQPSSGDSNESEPIGDSNEEIDENNTDKNNTEENSENNNVEENATEASN